MEVLPYINLNQDKKEQVACMFNKIAGKYDLLNHLLSFNIDKYWRRKVIRCLKGTSRAKILDIATGTGDLAIASLKILPDEVIGVDISEEMLKIGREKLIKSKLTGKVDFRIGDAEDLPFPDNYFDAVISGFGVRNFGNLNRGIEEAYRVLKKGGQLVVLEFSKPSGLLFGKLFNWYFLKILPGIGGLISGDQQAYLYLPESVNAFPDGSMFLDVIRAEGFGSCSFNPLTFGIATVYSGFKE